MHQQWAGVWPRNAAGSPQSPAPSEGPERPDVFLAPLHLRTVSEKMGIGKLTLNYIEQFRSLTVSDGGNQDTFTAQALC